MKRILFVCGTGGITSAIAEKKVADACKDAGLPVTTVRCIPTSVSSNLDNIDLIVSTTFLSGDFPVEVVNALNLITGIGADAVLDTIIRKLKTNPPQQTGGK